MALVNQKYAQDGSFRIGGDGEDIVALDATESLTTLRGIGTKAGTGVAVTETVIGPYHHTKFTFTNCAVALADEAGVVAYGGLKIYDFPQGVILTLGGCADLALTKSSAGVNADWDGDIGLGTTAAGNNNALATTEQNIIPTTATPQASSGATTGDMESAAAAWIDGSATAADVYLNILVDDTDHDVTGTACNIIVNGTLHLVWVNLGDN